eukprot:ANDGO_08371.mRNA.1 Dual specificity protein phosphatase 1B
MEVQHQQVVGTVVADARSNSNWNSSNGLGTFPNRVSEIIPGKILMGPFPWDIENFAYLKQQFGVTRIVNCTLEDYAACLDPPTVSFVDKTFAVHHIPMDDAPMQTFTQYLDDLFAFLEIYSDESEADIVQYYNDENPINNIHSHSHSHSRGISCPNPIKSHMSCNGFNKSKNNSNRAHNTNNSNNNNNNNSSSNSNSSGGGNGSDREGMDKSEAMTALEDQITRIHVADENSIDPSLLCPHQVIYIHCLMGVSRSAAVLLSILMRAFGLPLRNSLELVKKRRSVAAPNHGFFSQLLRLEEQWIPDAYPSMTYEDYAGNTWSAQTAVLNAKIVEDYIDDDEVDGDDDGDDDDREHAGKGGIGGAFGHYSKKYWGSPFGPFPNDNDKDELEEDMDDGEETRVQDDEDADDDA